MLKFLLCWTLLGSFCLSLYAQDLSTSATRRRRVRRPVKVTTPKSAKSDKWVDSILFNIGTHTEFFNNVQTSNSGEVRKIDLSTPVIGIGALIPLSPSWNFLPEFNWVLPKTQSHIMKNLFMYRADFGYDALDWLRLRVGTSIMHANYNGKGGEAKLNNGNSTSTFYYPDENRSSFNNTLDFGIEGRYDSFALRLQTYIYSVFIQDKRQVSYTLFLSYYWDR